MIITISHQDLNICMDCGLCGPSNGFISQRWPDESLPSNIAGCFLRFLHFIYFATGVNEFTFLFLERSLQILFILAGARFAEECEKGKWKNIAAYWTLLEGDNSRGWHECRTPPRQFNRDIINSYHVLTNIFGILAAICSS